MNEAKHQYNEESLDEATVDRDPLKLFERWLDEAKATGMHLPEAVTLATATPDGKPSARLVLLKGVDERGFVFFTNYQSRKARELDANPPAALVFYWPQLERQARVEGKVERTSAAESDAYFKTRPRESQIGAAASPQSEVISSRAALQEKADELEKLYEGREVERPEHWAGIACGRNELSFGKDAPAACMIASVMRNRPTAVGPSNGWHPRRARKSGGKPTFPTARLRYVPITPSLNALQSLNPSISP